ncbi:MAG: hypothetical protein IKR85_11885 [Clostridia bacterium]|nr:hypothetical protein [Clostridia bacterium]
MQSITQGSGTNALNFSYTYDNRGNITSETRNGVTTTYEYDALGQLTRVNDPNDPTAHNEGALSDNGTTWVYAYDRGGSILRKTVYAYTTGTVGTAVKTYAYEYDTDWKDKLTKFDGNTIVYDEIGTPENDGTWTYTWQAGRQLKSMSKIEGNDTITMEFTYNHAGLRTKKVVTIGDATETTEYILNGKNVAELIKTTVTAEASPTTTTDRLHFYYDTQGRVTLVDFNGTLYSYAHNLQGDIIGILDSSGNLVVEYSYDAWGKPISVTGTLTTSLGELNPFRYRGYVWDVEIESYYLSSRLYSSFLLRFINSDENISGNLYCYCENSVVMKSDKNGKSSKNDSIAKQAHDIIAERNAEDISLRLMNEMVKNYEALVKYRRTHTYIDSIDFFIDKVKTNGEWDIKNDSNWNLKSDALYSFCGIPLRRDEIGNIQFGFLSTALFSSTFAQAGAGLYQIYSRTSRWKYIMSGFDDPVDYYAIEYGYRLGMYTNAVKNGNSISQYLAKEKLDSYLFQWISWKLANEEELH